MIVVIAPDSFKGSLTAQQAAEAIAAGVKKVFPEAVIRSRPMADGGEGTVAALVEATGGRMIEEKVLDPLGRPIVATWGLLGDGRTAVVETAAASGLTLLTPDERNPLLTSTYGTGQLVKTVLSRGISRLIIGLGGSATVDGGAGFLEALGARILDSEGNEMTANGGNLGYADVIDISGLDHRLFETELIVASDVDNPLLGSQGAAAVFGPQKGATPEMVFELDLALANWASLLEEVFGQSTAHLPGAGAAGGLGAVLLALGAKFRAGVELVMELSGLKEAVADAHLVITGEGRIDSQTIRGKAPYGVARLAQRYGVPVVAIAGTLGPDYEELYRHGFDAVADITSGPMSIEETMARAPELLTQASERYMRLIKLGMKL